MDKDKFDLYQGVAGIALMIAVGLGALVACSNPAITPTVSVYSIADSQHLGLMWDESSVWVGYSPQYCLLAAGNGRVFLIGKAGPIANWGLTALAAADGQMLWNTTDVNGASSMHLTASALYLGFSGVGRVAAYDPVSGKQLWITHLSQIDAVVYLAHNNYLLTAYTDTGNYYRLDEKGNIIETGTGESIRSLFKNETDLAVSYSQQPVYTEAAVYVRAGSVVGRVYAIDRTSDTTLWETEATIISNIAFGQNSLYVLRNDNYLLGLDTSTGEINSFVQFSLPPFPFGANRGGYCTAFDSDSQQVVASLGDSHQLFAFKPETP